MSLENKLAKKVETNNQGLTIDTLIKNMSSEISKALPKHITPERFGRIALTCIRLNPELLKCNQASLIGSLMQSAQLGLEPGVLGRAYLIPYRNSKQNTVDCQFQIGYMGYIDLVMRSGNIDYIDVHAVHEHDQFIYSYGVDGTLMHKPAIKTDRGEIYCYYAIARLKSGAYKYIVMNLSDIENHKNKYGKNNPLWIKEFEAMAKKTVLKKLCKLLPISAEILNELSCDETVKRDVVPNMAQESLDVLSSVSNEALNVSTSNENETVVEVDYKDSPLE